MADEQILIVDMRLRDNLTGPLAKAKTAVAGVGDAAQAQALKTSNAFAAAGDRIRASFSGIGADIQKGIGLGLGIGATQLVARGVSELTGFVKESIQAFADEEAGIKRLTQALEVNAPAWDRDSAAIERTIQSRQKLAFADDELRESLGSLTAATHDVDEGFRLQALAMDLARFQGISLVAASEQLVKVQAGSFRALKALGIELDKNATSTEALGAIQLVVAGQAEKFAETTAGAMARAGIAVQNLQEDIGEALAPAIEKAASALDDILSKDLPAFAENSKREVEDLSKGFRDLAEFIHLTDIADFSRDFAVFIHLAQDGRPAVTDITDAVIAQSIAMADNSRETLMSAKALAILSGDTDRLAAVEKALEDAAAAVTTEMNKQAAANLALEKTAAQNSATAKAWGVRIQDNAGLTQFFTSKVNEATKALSFFDRQLGATQDTLNIGGENVPTGGGTSLSDSFLSDLDQDQRNRDAAAARSAAAAAEAERRRAEALSKAKAAAADYATTLRDKLDTALRRAKDTATTLFDKLHDRHLQAIADTEKLAAKQHDAATQQINDLLRIKLEQSAAPVTEAEESQRRIEIARQRRDLGESLQSALAGGDPDAIRSAQESLQSFNAAQRINNLRLEQARLDAAAQAEARAKQKAADDQLAAAKLQAAKDIALENDRAKTQRAQFDRELAALKKRDAGASPAKVKADIAKLEEKFGITRDAKGFSHIDDLAAAAKNLKPPFKDIGDAAAVATPRLAAVGASATAASDGLAVFTKRLGELKVLELPIPKPIEPPVIREPEMPLDRPRHSVEDMLANAIKNIPIPVNQVFVGPINVYVPPITLNGRIVAAALATSQSPAATPGVRTGTLAPR